jgi:Zn-finger nucleic acid-binding protein
MKATPKTKLCKHCGKRINVKSRTCPFCAGRIVDRLMPRTAECPRCKVPLDIHSPPDEREEYNICPRCGGLWLDTAKFRRATRKVDVYKLNKRKGEYLRGALRAPLKYVNCVRCGKIMNQKNFARISGVIIDECGGHGIWLDSGELEKIRHFIADGGLDESRDRDIVKVRDELRELAGKVSQVAFTQKLLHFWKPKRWIFSGFR